MSSVANIKNNTHKEEYIVFLRAIATVAVVLYHSCPTKGTGEFTGNLIHILFNWCVPIFLLISGSLFLNAKKEISFKYMLRKTGRIVFIIFTWGYIYNFISNTIIERTISATTIFESALMIVKADTTFCYQFWYLYLIVGLYLLIPIFKCWTDKYINNDSFNYKSEATCIMCIWLLFSIIIPTIVNGMGIEGNSWCGAFTMYSGFFFYLLCGRYIDMSANIKEYRKFYFTIGVIYFIQMAILIYKAFVGQYNIIEPWYGYTSIYGWCSAVFIFYLAKIVNYEKVPNLFRKIYNIIAKYSLNIYVLHVIIIQIFRKLGITSELINPWIFPLVISSSTIVICIVISKIAKKIPLIKVLFEY